MPTRDRNPAASSGVAGSNGQVQFNDNGQPGGDSTFTFNKSTDVLTVAQATMTIGANVAFAVTTMSGTITLTSASPRYQVLDPDGSARNLYFPAHVAGQAWHVTNRGNGAEVITCRTSAAGTIGTINNDESATLLDDGTRWIFSVGAVTIV